MDKVSVREDGSAIWIGPAGLHNPVVRKGRFYRKIRIHLIHVNNSNLNSTGKKTCHPDARLENYKEHKNCNNGGLGVYKALLLQEA